MSTSSIDTLIIDVKTGREQPWHVAQVMIYMYALPRTLPQYRNVRLAGEIGYPIHTVAVPKVVRQGEIARNLASLIRRLASDTPPQRTPSAYECRFCDISDADCPERMDPEMALQEAPTAGF